MNLLTFQRYFRDVTTQRTLREAKSRTEKITLLPQQNVLLIQPQQTRVVEVTILLNTVTTVIVVVTIHIVVATIDIVTTTILVC